jgi:hypothetical protein
MHPDSSGKGVLSRSVIMMHPVALLRQESCSRGAHWKRYESYFEDEPCISKPHTKPNVHGGVGSLTPNVRVHAALEV